MTSVRLKELTKIFGNIIAVKNLNLSIPEGKFVSLLGPSGCGKTTTLRMIAGLEKPTAGEIYFGEEIVNDLPASKRDISMLFQNLALFPHMKVWENIGYPLKVRKIPKQEIVKKVNEVARMLRIERFLDSYPNQLSGGQQQRVALGRALIREPKVLLMDEPLSNIDAQLRTEMRIEIRTLQQKFNITTIYVTHDQLEAMTMSDLIVVMKDGEVQQIGTPNEIFETPEREFVAGFIGIPTTNFINCLIVEKNNSIFADAGSFAIKLPLRFSKCVQNKIGKEVRVSIRPQHILLNKKESGDTFFGKVIFVEFTGTEKIVHIKIGEHIIKAVCPSNFDAMTGDTLSVKFETEQIHLFSKDGKNIMTNMDS